jgi:hypothetical protein
MIAGQGGSTSISFEVKVNAGYVELECTGTYAHEMALQLYSQAFNIAVRENRAAVLVDVRQVTGSPPTLTDLFEQGVHVASLGSGSGTRIRFAHLADERMTHPQRFGEVVARSHGALIRVFTVRDEAVAWISS